MEITLSELVRPKANLIWNNLTLYNQKTHIIQLIITRKERDELD
jgi:hypothetical protein